MGLVVVVVMVEIELIDDHSALVRIIGYNSIINLKRQLLDLLDHKIQGRFYSAYVSFNNAHPCGKVLQTIVISCHHRKVVEALIPLDADKEANNTGLISF